MLKPRTRYRDRSHSVVMRQKVVKIVSFLIASFFICRLPFVLWYISLVTFENMAVPGMMWCQGIHHTCNALVSRLSAAVSDSFLQIYLNCGVNPIMYSFMNPRFIKTLQQLLFKLRSNWKEKIKLGCPHILEHKFDTDILLKFSIKPPPRHSVISMLSNEKSVDPNFVRLILNILPEFQPFKVLYLTLDSPLRTANRETLR